MMRLDKITRAAVDALVDVKGRDIVVFDVKKMTAIFDKVVVATGESNRQCRALASRVQEMVKAAGGRIYGIEGESAGEWVLVDIGDAVIHIMQPAIRQYYNLEELWAPAPKKVAAPGAKPARATKAAGSAKSAGSAKVDKPAKLAKRAKPAAAAKRAPAKRVPKA